MNIIVIGGSAGSLKSLKKITSNLTGDLEAAIFVVIHFPANKKSNLATLINYKSTLPAEHAVHDKIIEKGKIYVSVPDHHLIIKNGKIFLGNGPKENHFRPSIDVLFRSAALEYDSQVIGIILSGLMHDGVAGLEAIKKKNGIVIVQDPDDAEFSGMPVNALRRVAVDNCVPASAMAPLINDILNKPVKEMTMQKDDSLKWENEIALGMNNSLESISKFAEPTRYICPDCEGPLFRIKDEKMNRYRCFIGHAYTSETLLQDISEKLEHLLWTTYRTMDEKKELIENQQDHTHDLTKVKEELNAQMETIKKLIA